MGREGILSRSTRRFPYAFCCRPGDIQRTNTPKNQNVPDRDGDVEMIPSMRMMMLIMTMMIIIIIIIIIAILMIIMMIIIRITTIISV
jgi:hypothetical protein